MNVSEKEKRWSKLSWRLEENGFRVCEWVWFIEGAAKIVDMVEKLNFCRIDDVWFLNNRSIFKMDKQKDARQKEVYSGKKCGRKKNI
jgi:hypothetical protein